MVDLTVVGKEPATFEPPVDELVDIEYTNFRGEFGRRRIFPVGRRMFFGSNEWHKTPQYLIEAIDMEKGEIRTFAMIHISSWKPLRG